MIIEAIIFDLDQTLIDTTSISSYRESREWIKCAENLHTTQPFRNVETVIHELRKSRKIGVVTNSPRQYAENLLEHHHIFYDAFEPFNNNGRNKPYPDQLLSCLQKLHVEAEKCVYVGDDLIDIVAAKAAGLLSIGFAESKGQAKKLMHAMPHLLISNFQELERYISHKTNSKIIEDIYHLKGKIKTAKNNGNGEYLFRLLKEASELGDSESQFAIAKLLFKNPHLVKDDKDHFHFFWKAAYQMNPDAIHALGYFLEEDNQKEEAKRFYRTAAYLNNDRAKYKFAVSKMDRSSELKLQIAKEYLIQADKAGVREARDSLNIINPILNFEEQLKTSVSYDRTKNVFYLSDYLPSTGRQDAFSKQIIQVKQGELSAINSFVTHLKDIITVDLLIVNVPSSDVNKRVTGIRKIGLGLSKLRGTDGTGCLLRTCTKEKSSLGGERSLDIHFKTLKVQNTERIKGKHILLLDDIMTTGSSMAASEKLLLEAGAMYITKFVLGKTKS